MEALQLYLGGRDPYEIAKLLNAKYGTNFSNVQIRDKIRYYPEYHDYNMKRRNAQGEPPEQAELLKALTSNTKPLAQLAQGLRISEKVLQVQIDDLRSMGYLIEENCGAPRLCTTPVPEENVYHREWTGDRTIRFGAIGDTHLCNKWQQLSHLNAMYDIFEREGVQVVYHAGDVCDGYYKNRPEHIYELFKIGFDEQADYIIDNFPARPGIKTAFVLGNHDTTHIKNGGSNIGIRIAASRLDMEYLGLYNAKIMLTPNCSLEINHPGDGSQYAISYSLQKMVDAMSGGEKPKILLNGHHHKAFYLPTYRNIHSLEVGCFEAQTPFMKGKKIAAHVGGWICEAQVDQEGTVTRFKSEFIPFLVPAKDDY